MSNDNGFIFRQCITLRNGQRICKPKGQAFRIPLKRDGAGTPKRPTPNVGQAANDN